MEETALGIQSADRSSNMRGRQLARQNVRSLRTP
jgi:hypothetical protein